MNPEPTSLPLSPVLPGGWRLPEDVPVSSAQGPTAQPDGVGQVRTGGTHRPPVLIALPRQRSESSTSGRGGWTPPPIRHSLTRVDGGSIQLGAIIDPTPVPAFPVAALPVTVERAGVHPAGVDLAELDLAVVDRVRVNRKILRKRAVATTRVLPLHDAAPAAVRWRRPAIAGAVVAVLAAVTAAAPTFGEDVTSISVIIDGTTRTFSTVAGSVGGALASVGIQVGPRDVIAPAVTAPIGEGATISIRRGRLVTVTVDGRQRQRWTTATTVEAALVEFGLDDSDYQLSADRSRTIGTDGLSFSGRSLHSVTVVDGAHAAQPLRLPAATVAEVLARRNMSLGKFDQVSPAPSTAVLDGQRIVVTRVAVQVLTTTKAIAEPAPIVKQDANLGRGNTKVTQRGRVGARSIETRTTVTNGRAAEKILADTVVRQARPTITSVGTRETGRPESWSVPWDKMAFCESTSRWSVNTGNGTYGGIQFMTPTWLEYGGADFAPRADLATKEQQIIVGERLYAKEGLAPWHCARLLGWGFDQYHGALPG